MKTIQCGSVQVSAWENGLFSLAKGSAQWNPSPNFTPYVRLADGTVCALERAAQTQLFTTGTGKGVRWHWQGFAQQPGLAFETELWVETATEAIHLALIPRSNTPLQEVHWPAPFCMQVEAAAPPLEAYTVLPIMQGLLLPYYWPQRVTTVDPPYFLERSGYLPFFGQVCRGSAWMGIVETPWDAGYALQHPPGGPTQVHLVWRESMGALSYVRRVQLLLLENADYVTLCKQYRAYEKERGGAVTLQEKIARTPMVEDLVGSPVVHLGTCVDIKPESRYYNHEDPASNQSLTTFAQRAGALEALAARGISKAYVHLDGWGKAGYDREHPDVLPPNEAAGGTAGLRSLADTCHRLGYRLALHDQYRDYYLDSPTFCAEDAVLNQAGQRPGECTWYGGQQLYLCASQAPQYVRRNITQLKALGIAIDGMYLDVFSIVYLDECFDARHPMTRKECSAYRCQCFEAVTQHCGIVSSEEPLANTVDALALCHHAPYSTELLLQKSKPYGICVPLFNLVYHDCIFTPWSLQSGDASFAPEGQHGFLHALLNGGLCYLQPDADDATLAQARTVCALNRHVAKAEMVCHRFVENSLNRQRTVFSDGTTVEVDFAANTWSICPGGDETAARCGTV